MTKEEALFKVKAYLTDIISAEGYLEVEEIIKALEQEPCDDAISRKATVERLCKVAEFMNEKRAGLGSPYVMAALFIQDNKEEFPPVTPQPKTGHWLYSGNYIVEGMLYCSDCKNEIDVSEGYFKYCPNCGRRMQEVGNDKRRSKE